MVVLGKLEHPLLEAVGFVETHLLEIDAGNSPVDRAATV